MDTDLHFLVPDGELSAKAEQRTVVLPPTPVKPSIKHTAKTPKTDRSFKTKTKTAGKRPLLALLIAAHNEELVIENTIRSAIHAGMPARHIYVVDDNSSDDTSKIVKGILGPNHVIKVRRSGKGLALTKANRHFKLSKRYQWIHIADADGGFASNYFAVFRGALNPKYVAATGYVRSLPGGNVGQYRVFEYTLGQEVHRRFQALSHTVSVIPGPTSCFRADVFEQVNFANESLTEDFDVTIQIHRKKLGKIQFIPKAMAYTQDPRTVGDFVKQISRWNRGLMQGFLRHKLGRRRQRIDVYLTYQVIQNLLFFLSYFVLIPYMTIVRHSLNIAALAFLYDILILFVLTLATAIRAGRYDVVSSFPQVYMLRWVTLWVFLRSFVEVVFLRRFRVTHGAWSTAGRRYKQEISL